METTGGVSGGCVCADTIRNCGVHVTQQTQAILDRNPPKMVHALVTHLRDKTREIHGHLQEAIGTGNLIHENPDDCWYTRNAIHELLDRIDDIECYMSSIEASSADQAP